MDTVLNKYFRLKQGCVPVQGARRSLLCDLHRERYMPVSNELFEILAVHYTKSIDELEELYFSVQGASVASQLALLAKQGWIYRCAEAASEPMPFSHTWWSNGAQITNALFDGDQLPEYLTIDLVKSLSRLGCRHIQFRFFKPVDLLYFIKESLQVFEPSAVTSISILCRFDQHADGWKALLQQHNIRIQEIVCWGAPFERLERLGQPVPCNLLYIKERVDAANHCGAVRAGYFTANAAHYRESHTQNTCLSRKISIDTGGNIKNCPSMQKSFGNIRDTTLEEALNQPGFKDLWSITKNEVSVCRDCEFRHICTDCRAYLEEPADPFSKPLKCGYDPYSCTWQEWSTHPLKQKAIAFYEMEKPE